MRFLMFSILSIFSLSGCSNEPSSTKLPIVDIVYSPRLDSVCSVFRGSSVRQEWKDELIARRQEFTELWEMTGPALLETVETITGKVFPAEAFTARLTLCDLPSQSIVGISVNMRFALESFTQSPVPMRYKIDTLFHELLHNFFAENPVTGSVLIKIHADEPQRIRDHLHLFALQKAVLLKLSETEALKNVIEFDSQLPGSYYKRAWELVNASDTEYLKYVAEISR